MSRATKDYNSVDWNSLFIYDPEVPTGLRWKTDRMAGRWMKIYAARAGEVAGNVHTDKDKNYTTCTVPYNGSNWFAARVIWILHNGHLKEDDVVDHIDGNTLNNSVNNLRAVKQAINNRNASKRKDNNSGICGVHFTTANNHRGGVYTYVTSTSYSSNGKRLSKHFSVAKYGLLPAFSMACEHRNDRIGTLNTAGAGYTVDHGE